MSSERNKVEGYIGTGSTLRVSDNYANSSAAVEVSPVWSSEAEEIQFEINLLAHKSSDSDDGTKLRWDGSRLMLGDKFLYVQGQDMPAV